MARLGEHLVAAQLVGVDKVDQALRAQVVWGGRLGTNLIELGCIDLDGLSRALGQQHGVPAAFARHFDKADPELQAQLPSAIAKQFSVVPLVRLSPQRIAVVALDPLTRTGLEALAAAYHCDPRDGIVYSVAAEMRVLYHLERVYKIARPTRYLRSRSGTTPPVPQFDNVPIEIDSDTDVAVPIIIDERAHPTGRAEVADQRGTADDIAALIDQAIENAMTPAVDETAPQGRDRRTYVRTLADDVEPKPETLARIAIKRVAVSANAPTLEVSTTDVRAAAAAATGPDGAQLSAGDRGPSSLIDATRAIRRGSNRDRVAELVIETLERFVPECEAALLLVIRGDVAIGWKHFARGRASAPEIAVPLDQPGMIPSVIARKHTARSRTEDLGAIDQLLVRELGSGDGELVVAPVLIGDRVMCLVAAATTESVDTEPVDTIASAAGTAFARLIRDASR